MDGPTFPSQALGIFVLTHHPDKIRCDPNLSCLNENDPANKKTNLKITQKDYQVDQPLKIFHFLKMKGNIYFTQHLFITQAELTSGQSRK